MAVNPLTPGVYIDEISVFPPSVAPVATAIPAFIGYTEKGPALTPTRITSMLEYEQNFGVAFPELLTATLADNVLPAVAPNTNLSDYTLHYNMKMYFANGGGPCWIVSADVYDPGLAIDWTKFQDGIAATERIDEVTLLVVPEAISIQVTPSQRATLHSDMLDLCNKLKDRFSIMDVVADTTQTIQQNADAFRNNEVGNNNLKYGAAYYPALKTTLTRFYNDGDISIDDTRTGGTFGNTHTLSDVLNGIAASGTVTVGGGIVTMDTIDIAGVTFTGAASNDPSLGNFLVVVSDANASAINLSLMINANPTTSLVVTAIPPVTGGVVTIQAKVSGNAGNSISYGNGTGALTPSTSPNLLGGINTDKTLYNQITTALQANTMQLYPSATMAGIYASVDRDRGVWKAPANVSIAGVVAPSVNISAQDQENLNVDATSGKSINAIRAFAGKGILVWGGRTLAGNDNEWRYINVRRLFIFAEESIQKASEFVVFEPNDKNTWSRVRGLISNFLTNLWRDGALAGATPKDAYFVKVGLGETMTAQDILEGKLIIQVGLAAVRPAEFIILQFSHKLQES